MKEDDDDINNDTNNQINNNTNVELCLLTNEPLDKTMIEMSRCKHKFNYIPLYNEICQQKLRINKDNNYETSILHEYQIKCPYCRTIHDRLLPPSSEQFGLQGVKITKRVNSMHGNNIISCEYVKKKTVKNQTNVKCNSLKVYITKFGRYCSLHYNYLMKAESKPQFVEANTKKNNIQIINELFQTQNMEKEDKPKPVKNKVIKTSKQKTKNQTESELNLSESLTEIYSIFMKYCNKMDINRAIDIYNSKNKYRIKVTGTKKELLDRVFKHKLHTDLSLWVDTNIFKIYLNDNIENVKNAQNAHNSSIQTSEIINNSNTNQTTNTFDNIFNNSNNISNISNNSSMLNTDVIHEINNSLMELMTYYNDDLNSIEDDIEIINYFLDVNGDNSD